MAVDWNDACVDQLLAFAKGFGECGPHDLDRDRAMFHIEYRLDEGLVEGDPRLDPVAMASLLGRAAALITAYGGPRRAYQFAMTDAGRLNAESRAVSGILVVVDSAMTETLVARFPFLRKALNITDPLLDD